MNPISAPRILVIKLAALGDVLRTTCLLQPLKRRYPGTHITWLTHPNALDILKNNPQIDLLLASNAKTREKLAGCDFELIVNLEEDHDSCGLAVTAEAQKIVGGVLDRRGRPTYTPDADPWFGMGLLRPNQRGGLAEANHLKAVNTRTYPQILLSMLGLDAQAGEFILELDPENHEFATRFKQAAGIENQDLVVGLNTSAGARWPMKSLSPAKTARLARRLIADKGAKVILFGGGGETARNRAILRQCPQIIDAGTGNALLDFAALVELCDLLISSDSLALHIGTALKVPMVAFFGPTSAAEIDLYGRGVKIKSRSRYYCTYRKDDPLGDGIPGVEVADIMAGVETVLELHANDVARS